MKVINFSWCGYREWVKNIAKINSNNRKRILILGVKDGGVILAEKFYQIISECNSDYYCKLDFVSSHRPSTKNKKSNNFLGFLIRYLLIILPITVKNKLRIIEHNKLKKRKTKDQNRIVFFSHETNYADYDIVYLVDDAVDSGYSLLSIKKELKKLVKNDASIISCVVVLTQENPVCSPDHYMYNDVLIRFPWSLDAKNIFRF